MFFKQCRPYITSLSYAVSFSNLDLKIWAKWKNDDDIKFGCFCYAVVSVLIVQTENDIFYSLQVEEKFVSVKSKLQEGLMDHLYYKVILKLINILIL